MSRVTDATGRLRFHGLWLAVGIGLIVAIVYLSLTPAPIDLDLGANSDKLGHFMAYGSLMYWFCMLYPPSRRQLALAAGFCALGVGLEFLQGTTAYRSFDPADMAANCAGVAIGWFIARTPMKSALAWIEQLISRYGAA